MSASSSHLAIDLGAESGRLILGTLREGRLELKEVHRFRNGPVPMLGTLRWDLVRLWGEILEGLRMVAREAGDVTSVSVDSWGVDYVLACGEEPLVGPAFHYRDPRALGPYAELRKDPGEAFIYERTGIQFMPLNSLYQLVADVWRNRAWVEGADGMLMIADWFHWLLTGRRTNEETNASTTQLYDPLRRAWAWELIDRLQLPRALFGSEMVRAGATIGSLRPDVAEAVAFREAPPMVVACCTHDTGSAVVAVPSGEGEDWAYLSSGTWSLLGVELPEPILSDEARFANLTNEIGFGGSIRLLRNVIGLWLLQECRRQWEREGRSYEYPELMDLASEAHPLRHVIDADDARFLGTGDMPSIIRAQCRGRGEPGPETPGEVTRCILESLALLYAVRVDELEKVTGRQIRRIHVVGGGSQSVLLNQFTADATGREVVAGPVEATAIGNVLVQALATNELPDLSTARVVVRRSFQVATFRPSGALEWAEAGKRFAMIRVAR